MTADENKKIKLWTINKIDNIIEKYMNNILENESNKEDQEEDINNISENESNKEEKRTKRRR